MSGKYFKFLQRLNIRVIFVTLFVFHFDISGNSSNKWQKQNIKLMSATLLVSHLDISGNFLIIHSLNIPPISVTLSVFQFEISGISSNELHKLNIYFISVTLIVFQFVISEIIFREVHELNILRKEVTLVISHFSKFKRENKFSQPKNMKDISFNLLIFINFILKNNFFLSSSVISIYSQISFSSPLIIIEHLYLLLLIKLSPNSFILPLLSGLYNIVISFSFPSLLIFLIIFKLNS